MSVNDIVLTKVPNRVLNRSPKGLKARCKTLKVGQALPVKTLGWAANLKTQLNEATCHKYEYWTEPQISAHKYRQLNDMQRRSIKVFIGRIA
ncbi:hypothetical protein G5B30_16715 [Sphingobacterium sp. SGG-5]|uniref:hypothetical protein n=1 Tax=Sphingobacterium sp. SGG-5 TaxID=2710881 RepID=UPI0013EBED56|nr:hypothetical protein [Sphingobacterium sp. SGG-5]NGM63553.1 hypothetical protein [Sphingobacterium sp. SGG-5]